MSSSWYGSLGYDQAALVCMPQIKSLSDPLIPLYSSFTILIPSCPRPCTAARPHARMVRPPAPRCLRVNMRESRCPGMGLGGPFSRRVVISQPPPRIGEPEPKSSLWYLLHPPYAARRFLLENTSLHAMVINLMSSAHGITSWRRPPRGRPTCRLKNH